MEKANFTNVIKKNGRNYLFNSLYGTLDEVDERIASFDLSKIHENESRQLLKRRHLQEESQIKDIKRMYIEYSMQTPSVLSFFIPLTKDCNLDCIYCFQKKQAKHNDISIENLHRIEDSIINIMNNENVIKNGEIVIYGGEPLLIKNELYVRDIIEFCKKNDIKCRIITNGTTINYYYNLLMDAKSVIKEITITLDGGKKTHDRARFFKSGEGSYDLIMGNIKKIRGKLPYTIRVNMTSKIIDEIKSKNFPFKAEKISFHQALFDDKPDKNCSYGNLYRMINSGEIDINKLDCNPVRYFYYLVHSDNNYYPLFNFCNSKNTFLFSLDGKNIYNCNEQECQVVWIGNYDTNNLKLQNTNELIIDAMCSNCCYFPICGGGCKVHRTYTEDEENYLFCNYYQEIHEMVNAYIDYVVEEENKER